MGLGGRSRILASDGKCGELRIEWMSGRPLVQQALGAQEEGLVHALRHSPRVLKGR